MTLKCDAFNWKPFIPPNEGSFGRFGITRVLQGTIDICLPAVRDYKLDKIAHIRVNDFVELSLFYPHVL